MGKVVIYDLPSLMGSVLSELMKYCSVDLGNKSEVSLLDQSLDICDLTPLIIVTDLLEFLEELSTSNDNTVFEHNLSILIVTDDNNFHKLFNENKLVKYLYKKSFSTLNLNYNNFILVYEKFQINISIEIKTKYLTLLNQNLFNSQHAYVLEYVSDSELEVLDFFLDKKVDTSILKKVMFRYFDNNSFFSNGVTRYNPLVSLIENSNSNFDHVNSLNVIEDLFSKMYNTDVYSKDSIPTRIYYADFDTKFLFYNMTILREIFRQDNGFSIVMQTYYSSDKTNLKDFCVNFLNQFVDELWCNNDNITIKFNSIKVKIMFITLNDPVNILKDTKLIIDETISRNLNNFPHCDNNTLYVRQCSTSIISKNNCIIHTPSKYYDMYKDNVLDYIMNGNIISENELLEKYKAIGSVEQIIENTDRLMQRVQTYESLGDPEKILKGLEQQVQSQLDELKLYKSLGTVKELENYKCKYLKLYSTLYSDIVDNYTNQKYIHEIDPLDLRLD